jgi:type I restriction enzyme S subunit
MNETGVPTYALSDLVEGGQISYGIVQPGNHVMQGVPIVRVKDVRNGTVDLREPMRVTPDIAERHSKTKLRGGELLLSLVGTVGETAVVTEDLVGWNVARAIAVIRPQGVEPGWLRLAFQMPEIVNRLDSMLNTTVQSTLNLSDLKRLQIPLPEASVREGILDVLGALDDKIAANAECASHLADLGRAMYSQSIQADSDVVVLSDVTTLVTRGVAPSYTDEAGSMMVLNQKCVRGQRIEIGPARLTHLSRVRADKVLLLNDVLVNSTGQGTLGRVARWTRSERATVDSHISIVRFDNESVDPVCGGLAILREQETIEEMGEGSTGQTELSRSELAKLPVRLPRRDLQERLGQDLAAMVELEDAELTESASLATTRDTLLPLLMSGKVRVKDAEKQIEAVV